MYSTTRYEGAINLSGLSGLDFSNIAISQIQMRVTFGPAGGDSTKRLTFYKATKNSISGSIATMRGSSIGYLTVSQAYDRTTTLTFNASTNAGMATPVPVANGGTGASTAKAALNNLGIFYSATLPSSGTDGQICLVPV